MNQLRLCYLDDEALLSNANPFGNPDASGRIVISGDDSAAIDCFSDPDRVLLDLTLGKFPYDGLLLDVNFAKHPGNALLYTDPPSSEKARWGFDVLRTVKRIDPDLPVVILTGSPASDTAFQSGRLSADEFFDKGIMLAAGDVRRDQLREDLTRRIRQAQKRIESREAYDHDHLVTADDFAKDYDTDEQKCVGTVAYYHFENDLISQTIAELLSTVGDRRIRILDVGCGTGRIAAYLGSRYGRVSPGRLEIVGVDFSGKMIAKAQSRLSTPDSGCTIAVGKAVNDIDPARLSVSLFRAPAEGLEFLKQRYPEQFDFIISGFGVPSYVRYHEVFPPSGGQPSSRGVFPLLRAGGRLLFSVYNEESSAYTRGTELKSKPGEFPVAALMDMERGVLQVGESRVIRCDAFSTARIRRLIQHAGFQISRDGIQTFPSLHLMLDNSHAAGDMFEKHPYFEFGRFSPLLYELDRRLSTQLPGRGHYIVGIAEKPSSIDGTTS